MSRFDPDTYPDRQSFEALARRLRREEFDRLLRAAVDRLGRALSGGAQRLMQPAAPFPATSAVSSSARSPT